MANEHSIWCRESQTLNVLHKQRKIKTLKIHQKYRTYRCGFWIEAWINVDVMTTIKARKCISRHRANLSQHNQSSTNRITQIWWRCVTMCATILQCLIKPHRSIAVLARNYSLFVVAGCGPQLTSTNIYINIVFVKGNALYQTRFIRLRCVFVSVCLNVCKQFWINIELYSL